MFLIKTSPKPFFFKSMTHPNLHIFLFYIAISLLFSFSPSTVISSSTSNRLSEHCSSFFPETLIQTQVSPKKFSWPYSSLHSGYFTTKPGSLSPRILLEPSNSVTFTIWSVHETSAQDLFSVDTELTLRTRIRDKYRTTTHYSDSTLRHFSFELNGLWSKSDGRLCAVGESFSSPRGESNGVLVIIKLYNLYNHTNITDLVSGNLESLVGSDHDDPDHFELVSIVLFPKLNYEYTLASKELGRDSGDGLSPGLPLESLTSSICSLVPFFPWSLRYPSHCKSAATSSSHKCSPLTGDFLGQLPGHVELWSVGCSEAERALRFLIKFPVSSDYDMWDDGALDPKSTLVGEGIWDSENNRLFVVACRHQSSMGSLLGARVSDCSIRLSLKSPAVWTIRNSQRFEGRVWSVKKATEPGYFEEIGFRDSQRFWFGSSRQKYEYTKIDQAKKWCPEKESDNKIYPNPGSKDMSFDIVFRTGTGYVKPMAIDGRASISPEDSRYLNRRANVSFQISFFNVSWEKSGSCDIAAEGIYDGATGSLCMVGCRNLEYFNNSGTSSDCEILVDFQFPEWGWNGNRGFIKGRIESKRKESDPLYFETVELSSTAYVSYRVKEYVWIADLEIVFGLISNTLACVFTVSQIFHLRKNPDSRPFVSLVMLATMTLGYSIPLGINLRAILVYSFETRDVLVQTGRWIQAKSVIQGVTSMALLLFQARLLQLTWSARSCNESQNALRVAENEALLVSLPLYFGGVFFTVFLAWSRRINNVAYLLFTPGASFYGKPLLSSLSTCSDLLLDGFLVPQVLLNVLRDSKERPLSRCFYFGVTFVRVLTHAFGLYMGQSYAWDVILAFGSLVLVSVVNLQQKFGGRYILPLSLRESNVCQVSNVAETQI